MAIQVVEFSNGGYKIRNIFSLKNTNLGAHFFVIEIF
jgi:hypothetical protein